ncbi:hypothetical protein Q5P01_002322 [Channa striata]|uniref:BZIP domain-containing protein n=1 Tax=Channa striata TaxID=64152 RepID=A0AA88T7Y2_CHASR|nr:hypothetical protein Q5P01_002322 [Channa striata]
MSPLFMDTECELNTPGSLSADDSNSHTAGSEREGEGPQHLVKTGTKRREKNRDAARKSRKKQTERADELHEELQNLERSNSALQKEIAALKKDLSLYTTALERHEPYCRLRAPTASSSSSTCHLVSSSADCRTSSSPTRRPLKGLRANLSDAPSISTSLNSSLGLQSHDFVENTCLSPSAPTTLASSSCSVTSPYSLSFSTLPAPHSLFSEGPLITSRPTNVSPVSTSPVANPIPSSALTGAAQPQSVQDALHETSSLSADACFSTLHSDTLDAFAVKQNSFISASSNLMPPYSHYNSSSVLPSSLQDPALQSHAVSPQTFPAHVSALKPSCNGQIAPNPSSLLSLLTVPSPLTIPQTTSSTFGELVPPSPPLLPPSGDPSKDIFLSELLEGNEWILSGNNNQ